MQFTVYTKVANAWVYQGMFSRASDAIACARWFYAQGVKEIEIDDGTNVQSDEVM